MTSKGSLKPSQVSKVIMTVINCLDTQPNIDFFTRDQLKEIVKKFKKDA